MVMPNRDKPALFHLDKEEMAHRTCLNFFQIPHFSLHEISFAPAQSL